ncbi:MAG TPA: DUF2298 domain-containing protein [Roseiflexaceae bacterium]|nr:DUF2298 domain-containing protein [Roseiflexaceae bacterium]
MAHEVLIYWLLAQVFGLAGLPLARALFHALPDSGYAFAKALGLLLTGYLAWLIAMLGLAPFGAPLIAVCLVLVAAGGLLAGRGAGAPEALGFRAAPAAYRLAPLASPLAWLRESWRTVLGYEALFALALLFLALLRGYEYGFVGPNPWGTERPMDYALFNAIRQSERFPPHDPWLAGYSINYYYFGYLLMAAVSELGRLNPAVSYNLSLALIFALAALGAAGVVYNLIGLTATERSPSNVQRSTLARWSAMALAVVLVLFAGNQGGALQVITGSEMAVALRGPDLARAVVNGLGPRATIPLGEPFRGEYFDGATEIVPGDQVEGFNWWNSSRAVWDTYPDGSRRYAITEFPFFSFWLGDMHPHVMALPFGLLAMALALHTLARPDLPNLGGGRHGWLELLLTGAVLGSLYVINSWDLPTYLLLFLAALAVRFGRALSNRRSAMGQSTTGATSLEAQESANRAPIAHRPSHSFLWRAYARQAALVLLAAFVLFLPFHLTFTSLVGGKEPLVDLPLLGALTRTIGFVTWGRTELHQFLVIFGLFLVPLLAYTLAQTRRADEDRGTTNGERRTADDERRTADEGRRDLLAVDRWSLVVGRWSLVVGHSSRRWTLWLTTGTALLAGALVGFPLLALLPLGVGAAQLALTRARDPAAAFTLGAFALGCAICLGAELIYIRDVFESRLNTIFKFYYQVWLIWGVLAAYAVWWLVDATTKAQRHEGTKASSSSLRAVASSCLRGLATAVWLLLLAGALVYPWLTAGKAFGEGRWVGLHGVTPRERTPEGAAAIAWLRANAPGDAVVLEAVGPAYDTASLGFGGVSAATGLATVVGWEGHQQQWRGGQPQVLAEVGRRAADVATIYSTPDAGQARELLARYGVDYIYVGTAERTTYPPEGLAKLDQIGTPVFQQGEVTIYRVAG